MSLHYLEKRAIDFEHSVAKLDEKTDNSNLLQQIIRAQKEAFLAAEKARKLYAEYVKEVHPRL